MQQQHFPACLSPVSATGHPSHSRPSVSYIRLEKNLKKTDTTFTLHKWCRIWQNSSNTFLSSDYSERGPGHVARLVVGGGVQGEAETDTEVTSEVRSVISEARSRGKVERSNSRVTKVSNLIKWPKNKDKDKSSTAANLYVSDTSQV